MTFLDWYLPGLLLLSTGLGAWAFVVWWRRDRYRRQSFAFVGFSALAGLATLALTSLLTNTSLFAGVLTGILRIFGVEAPAPAPLSPLEAIVVLVLVGLLVYAYLQVFKHWTAEGGQRSLAQYEEEQNGQDPNVFRDIALFLAWRAEHRKLLEPYSADADQREGALQQPETLTWHERARQLWSLRNRGYLFDNSDYVQEHRCWLGLEKNTGALALLGCFREAPSDDAIRSLLAYGRRCASQQGRESIELILAVKDRIAGDTAGFGSDGVRWVDEHTLLEGLVDFGDYFADIRYRVERQRLVDSELTLKDTYSPSRYRLSEKGPSEPRTLEDFVIEWLEQSTRQQLAVLGEYGQGKSTASLLVCHHLIERLPDTPATRIPILIELRGKTLRTMTPEELLASWALAYRLDVQALLHLHMAGRLLLIFEGFDEIDLSGDTEARISHFRTLWRLNYDGAKIIITGRPNFFLDSVELRRALGKQDQTRTLHLAPFEPDQIADALRSFDAATRAEITELARCDPRFLDVASRPSLLYMAAVLWRTERLSERGHIDSALVIDLFIKQTLSRQQQKHDQRPFMVLNSAERPYFMLGVAAYMAVQGLPNQIGRHQLEAVVNRLVEVVPEAVSRDVSTVDGESALPLRSQDRLDWANRRREILDKINTDVRSCGLLVTDPSKDGSFKFAHKSYMELLQAKVVSLLYAMDEAERRAGISIVNAWRLRIEDLQGSDEREAFIAELLNTRLNEAGIQMDARGNSGTYLIASELYRIVVVNERFEGQGFFFQIRDWFARLATAGADLVANNNRPTGSLVRPYFGFNLALMFVAVYIFWAIVKEAQAPATSYFLVCICLWRHLGWAHILAVSPVCYTTRYRWGRLGSAAFKRAMGGLIAYPSRP